MSTSTSAFTAPTRPLPRGACDTHAHVFGPFEQFPLADPRPYTPPAAPKAQYLAMLDAVGFERGVLVHGGAHGWDHGAMLDAIASAPRRLRGIGVLPADASEADLRRLHEGGVRGLRFTDVAGPTASTPFAGRVGLDALERLAPAMRELGWHAVVWANASVWADRQAKLRRLGVPIVIDHLGFFDVSRGVEDAGFQAVLALVRDGAAWVKLTVFRNSRQPPGYEDVRPFQDALVQANADRLLWGSDWPYLGMGAAAPGPRALLDLLDSWLDDDALRTRILVDNPARLYGFD